MASESNLFGRRKQRTRIRSLEIIQNEAPAHPSVADAVIDDGMGEFRIAISSIRQRYLEAFRLRSEHAASIEDGMRAAIAARLVEEYGSTQGVGIFVQPRHQNVIFARDKASSCRAHEPARLPPQVPPEGPRKYPLDRVSENDRFYASKRRFSCRSPIGLV